MLDATARTAARLCLLAGLCVALLAAPPARAEQLPEQIGRIIDKNGLPRSRVGLYLARADGSLVAAHNADELFNPASTIKLITSMAALDELGPGHVWETRLLAAAPLVGSDLRGDLYLQGGGDPFMTNERLLHLVAGLARRGVRSIAGAVVVDDTLFDLPPHDPAGFDGAGFKPYNAAAGAAVVNFGSSQVFIKPLDGDISVFVDPPSTTFTVSSKLSRRKGRCDGNWRSRIRERLVRNDDGSASLELGGGYPVRCGEQHFFLLAQPDPAAHAAGAVAGTFAMLGGTVADSWRRDPVPRRARVLAAVDSPTLGEVIRGMNKFSNNFMARNLFLSLAASQGKPYTLAKARAVMAKWFAGMGIDTTGMFIDNGSGLSRTSRITPRQFGEALADFNQRPIRHELIASLAILGRDGTVRSWNKREPSRGGAHVKTGTLSNVRAVAGVVHNPAGDMVLVMMFDTANTWAARRAIQQTLDWVYRTDSIG